MSIVEEADSVKAAKSIISKNGDIDIVFTDIVMPEQDGLQLIRWCHERYPLLPVVVLTYHNDFSYIQEALRLGAIDYIIKTELESSNFGVTMKRIEELALYNKKNKVALVEEQPENRISQAIVISGAETHFLSLSEFSECNHLFVDSSTLLITLESPLSNKLRNYLEKFSSDKAIMLLFSPVVDKKIYDIIYFAKLFMRQEFFYRHLPNLYFYDVDTNSFEITGSKLDPKSYRWVEEQLSSLSWINDDILFKKIILEIKKNRLAPSMVFNLFFELQLKWQHIFNSDSKFMDYYPISEFDFWYQWLDWIKYLQQQLKTRSGISRYKKEIAEAMQKLIIYLSAHFQEDISLSQAAEMTQISISYFTKCFRDITGKSFYSYLRDLRIEHACKLLTQTNSTIAKIAELCGFSDQFYFSKLFKKITGIPPGAYRSNFRSE